jgi:PPK2 family polyphosphate:nucleotide phosphotransferase
MKIIVKAFKARPGHSVDLADWPTLVRPAYASKAEYLRILADHVDRLSTQQELLFAAQRHALLIIFQAMDSGGKDGCIKHVMSGVNPQGCNVFTYRHPTSVELRHDFLWRTTRDLPERGMICIFNRSYYEEVLIVRVHPNILNAENLPDDGHDKHLWKERFHSINGLERHLHNNGTRIIKVFLHISKEEQRKRLLDRIDTPQKNWKITPDDIKERHYWEQYQKAYGKCLSATTTEEAPWHIVPADDKRNARLFVSQIILDALDRLDMRFPDTTAERRRELGEMRKALVRSN